MRKDCGSIVNTLWKKPLFRAGNKDKKFLKTNRY
jgi:hypothetical protein